MINQKKMKPLSKALVENIRFKIAFNNNFDEIYKILKNSGCEFFTEKDKKLAKNLDLDGYKGILVDKDDFDDPYGCLHLLDIYEYDSYGEDDGSDLEDWERDYDGSKIEDILEVFYNKEAFKYF